MWCAASALRKEKENWIIVAVSVFTTSKTLHLLHKTCFTCNCEMEERKEIGITLNYGASCLLPLPKWHLANSSLEGLKP